MDTNIVAIIKATRPRQWIKNLAVFAPILFTGHVFEYVPLKNAIIACIVLCLLSSSNYLFNDILDRHRDRKHPFKKFRPIASGAVSIPLAVVLSISLFIFGLGLSLTVTPAFTTLALLFSALQYTYTLILKHISLVDILSLTTFYFLRVYAGEAATGFHISIWLSLTVLCLALFLAIGKRRAELTLLEGYSQAEAKDTRKTLRHYSEPMLDTFTAMFANSTFISYAMFTFLVTPVRRGFILTEPLQDVFITNRKWMMLTIPFVLYGIMRYMQLIYEGKGESPEKIITSDIPLLLTILSWGLSVLILIYAIA